MRASSPVTQTRPDLPHCGHNAPVCRTARGRATIPQCPALRDHVAEDRRADSPSTAGGPPPAADLGNEDDDRVHSLELPFRLRDRDGTVHVEVVPNANPEELGHHLVAVGYDEDRFRGFPCLTATITYAGAGPRAWMGWVQLIERRDIDGSVTTQVDGAPVFEQGSPLYAFGYLPTFSDFPANPDHPDGDWVAQTFLVAIPDVVRSTVLVPVTAFSWDTVCETIALSNSSSPLGLSCQRGTTAGPSSTTSTLIGHSSKATAQSESLRRWTVDLNPRSRNTRAVKHAEHRPGTCVSVATASPCHAAIRSVCRDPSVDRQRRPGGLQMSTRHRPANAYIDGRGRRHSRERPD